MIYIICVAPALRQWKGISGIGYAARKLQAADFNLLLLLEGEIIRMRLKHIKLDKRKMLEDMILGLAGLIAFTIISFFVYLIGLIINLRSLREGFASEIVMLRLFPLFFILVAVIKIFIGGNLIEGITRILSKTFRTKILADKSKK